MTVGSGGEGDGEWGGAGDPSQWALEWKGGGRRMQGRGGHGSLVLIAVFTSELLLVLMAVFTSESFIAAQYRFSCPDPLQV